MKTLVLFLACLAAANAASYVYPHCGYTYYSPRIYVTVPSSCFHYTVYNCRLWYTTKYYSGTMKVYPGEKCGEDDFQEMSEADFKADCEGKLATKASDIQTEMNDKYDEWEKKVGDDIVKYKADYKTYIDEYTAEYLKNVEDQDEIDKINGEAADKIAEFNKDLDDRFTDAKTAYTDAINAQYAKVVEYHEKIVESAVKCYNDRNTKIGEFEVKIGERVDDLLERYKKCYDDVIEKKTTRYHELLKKVHCDEQWEVDLVTKVVEAYRTSLETERDTKYGEYEGKLNEAKTKLIGVYTCAYQCYTYSGCLSFSSRSYSCACKSLGTWWSYSYTTKISYFRYVKCTFSWTPREYKCLRTCELDTLNVSIEDFNKSIQDKADVATKAADDAFTEWKEKWNGEEGYHAKYLEKYMDIVDKRHKFCVDCLKESLSKDGEFSDEDATKVQEHEDDLAIKRADAEAEYKKILDDRFESASKVYSDRLECYKTRVGEMVTKITDNYKCCMDTRTEKIGEYEEKMKKVRDDLKKCLTDRLTKIGEAKAAQYKKLLEFYHGEVTGDIETLYNTYEQKITSDLAVHETTFDDHWTDLLPKLVLHYSCGYKCRGNVNFCVPSFNYCVGWRVCYPTDATYCYQYSFYLSHRYYC